jgi:osmotically-inducible protein OsmY
MAYRDYDEGYRSRQHGREYEGSTYDNERDDRWGQSRDRDEFSGSRSYGRGREQDWRDREMRSSSREGGFGEDWQGGRYGRGGRMRDEMQGRSSFYGGERDWNEGRYGGGISGGREWNEGRFGGTGGGREWNEGRYGRSGERSGSFGQETRSRYSGDVGGTGRGEFSRYGGNYGDFDYAGSSDYDRYGESGMRGGSSGEHYGRYSESGREFGRSVSGSGFGGSSYGYGQGGSGQFGPSTGYGYGTAGSYLGQRSDWGSSGTSQRQNYMGRGPRNYKRSEDRIREEINERLTRHPEIDASDVDVRIENNTVVLSGVVEDRKAKRLAEDLAEEVWGVEDVRNELKVRHGFLASLTGEQADDREVRRTTAREGVTGTESKTKTGRSGSTPGSTSTDTNVGT